MRRIAFGDAVMIMLGNEYDIKRVWTLGKGII
jgi:hypothetical protein